MSERTQINLAQDVLILETGKMAKQADGAVTVQLGETVVLVTAVCSKEAREGVDFLPLTVEYREKTYAAGKIPGGYFKKEGRPSEKEILSSRLIDRSIRPLFPSGMVNEIQVMAMVISSDGEHDSDILAMIGASAALSISNIPFNGPIGTVRVGRIDGEFVLNPTFKELEKSSLDLVVAGGKDGIAMIESGSDEVSEEIFLEGVKFAHEYVLALVKFQEEFTKRCGVPKIELQLREINPDLEAEVKEMSLSRLGEINRLSQKEQREEALDLLSKELIEKLVTEESGYKASDVKSALIQVEKETVRRVILEEHRRVDGRKDTDIRPITCEVGVLPRTHGSALFTRGQTQSLSVITLGTGEDEQMIDALEGEMVKSFMLHYYFPPFSVGEVRPERGPGRREIGHGALAERALKPLMPSKEAFPYTVRVVSDILESNGSSSMATVCSSSLSLMDAGVPVKRAAAGIAIGLVKEGQKEVLLVDIGGVEDHFGDMDFKVAGTKEGITAVQLDLKIEGIGMGIIKEAMVLAKSSRFSVLEIMEKAISEPRSNISKHAPRIFTIKVPQDKIGEIIGPGGKVIKKIIADTGASIDIDDDGTVHVASTDEAAALKALETIRGMIEIPEVGKIYKGKITRIMPFGAFCQILPNAEGLIHISELSGKYVQKVEDVVKVGDEIQVKVVEIDELNRVNLSARLDESVEQRAERKRSSERRPPPGRPGRPDRPERRSERPEKFGDDN